MAAKVIAFEGFADPELIRFMVPALLSSPHPSAQKAGQAFARDLAILQGGSEHFPQNVQRILKKDPDFKCAMKYLALI